MTLDTKFNPNTSFGGTWERDKGGFIYADYDECTSGYRGNGHTTIGTAITIEQMPSHYHGYEGYIDMNPQGGYDKVIVYGNPQGTKYYTFGTQSTGGNQEHKHNMPWIGVMFWKRVG